jgi:hypothetical protein
MKELLDVLSKHTTLEDGGNLADADELEDIDADVVIDLAILDTNTESPSKWAVVVDEETEERVNLDAGKSLSSIHAMLN